jgi:type IV secretion system protein VirB6
MASGLAGGVSMAAMRIRHLISSVTSGLIVAKGAANMTNPVRTRRDRESGMTTARQANHLVAGNTM